MSGRILAAGLLLAALAVPALGYINGGDYKNSLDDFAAGLKKAGWSTAIAQDFTRPDADRTQYINKLVGEALNALPYERSKTISPEAKREFIKLAREAIEAGLEKKQSMVHSGESGNIAFRAGVESWSSYYSTSERGRQQRYKHRAGLAAYVAVKWIGKEEK